MNTPPINPVQSERETTMPMSRIEPAVFICQCGAVAHTAGAVPPGWEWRGTSLLCGDCLTSGNGDEAPAAGRRSAA